MIVKDYLRPAAVRAGVLSSAIEKTNGRNVMVITDGRTFGFHALRHSLATFLVSKDVDPKTVQAMLRHSNVTTTLQLYAKTVDGKRLKAQEQVLAAISRPRAGIRGSRPPCMRIMGGSGLGQGRQIIDSDGERGWIRTSDPRLKRSLPNGN